MRVDMIVAPVINWDGTCDICTRMGWFPLTKVVTNPSVTLHYHSREQKQEPCL